MCLNCSDERRREAAAAVNQVKLAIRRGELAPAASQKCQDCGKPATQHDHRDYLQPLKVDPVCRSCNQKRGVAFDSKYRPAHEFPAPIAVNTGEVSSLLLQGAASGGLP